MFGRLLLRSISRRRSRKLLAVVAVWTGSTLLLGFLGLGLDVGDKMNRELRQLGANIRVVPAAAAILLRVGGHELTPTLASSYLDENHVAELKNIFWRNNIMGIVPRLWTSGSLHDIEVPLLGVWFEHKIPLEEHEIFTTGARQVYTHWQVQGDWPSEAAACLVGVDVAEHIGGAVADTLHLVLHGRTASFFIAGIVRAGDDVDRAVILPLASLQRISELAGCVSEVDVSALTTPENKLSEKYRLDPKLLTMAEYDRWYCTPFPGSVALQIQEAIPGSVARVVRRVSESQGVVLGRLQGLMAVLGGLAAVACMLSVLGVLTAAVLERRSEVALLQALGAQTEDVLRLFFSEAITLGLLGGALASVTSVALGRWLVHAVFQDQAELRWVLVILAPVVGLVIAVVASAIPVAQMLKQRTAQVLNEG